MNMKMKRKNDEMLKQMSQIKLSKEWFLYFHYFYYFSSSLNFKCLWIGIIGRYESSLNFLVLSI